MGHYECVIKVGVRTPDRHWINKRKSAPILIDAPNRDSAVAFIRQTKADKFTMKGEEIISITARSVTTAQVMRKLGQKRLI